MSRMLERGGDVTVSQIVHILTFWDTVTRTSTRIVDVLGHVVENVDISVI